MLSFATRLLAILTTLRQAIAVYAGQQNRAQNLVWIGTKAYAPSTPQSPHRTLPAETWLLIHTRLNRIAARFNALFQRWQTNTLPIPRAPQPRAAKPRPPAPRLPSTRGWVNARIAAAAPCAGMLDILLHDPELPKFLADAPQAGRLLRPLCHALGLPEPPCLKRNPNPRRTFTPLAQRREPERGRPTNPPPQAPSGTPDRPLPPYIRAAVRAWKKLDK